MIGYKMQGEGHSDFDKHLIGFDLIKYTFKTENMQINKTEFCKCIFTQTYKYISK